MNIHRSVDRKILQMVCHKKKDIFCFSNPDELLKSMVKIIQRRDHLEEIQTILQTHLANLPDATTAEMQAHVWLQWARQKKHLKVNIINCIIFFMSINYLWLVYNQCHRCDQNNFAKICCSKATGTIKWLFCCFSCNPLRKWITYTSLKRCSEEGFCLDSYSISCPFSLLFHKLAEIGNNGKIGITSFTT